MRTGQIRENLIFAEKNEAISLPLFPVLEQISKILKWRQVSSPGRPPTTRASVSHVQLQPGTKRIRVSIL